MFIFSWIEKFNIDPTSIESLIKLILSFLAGFIIGLEREKSGHPAGLKTHVLVCVGACLIMIISMNAFDESDPARLAAQVVSGMGFIGAGAIMRDNASGGIKGITTAATLWVTAGIGLGLGAGMYFATISVIILVTFALIFIKQIEYKFIHKDSVITLVCESNKRIAEIVIGTFNDYGIEIKDFVISPIVKEQNDSLTKVTITLTSKAKIEPKMKPILSTLREKLEPKSFHVKNL